MMPATENTYVDTVALTALRRTVAVELTSSAAGARAAVVLKDDGRALILIELKPVRLGDLAITLNGVTARVAVMPHHEARWVAEELARQLCGKDPLLSADVRPAMSEPVAHGFHERPRDDVAAVRDQFSGQTAHRCGMV